MVEKKLIVLGLICVVLSGGVIGAIMMLNQKDLGLQIKTDQISELENERNALEAQVATLQANVSTLQSEATALNKNKAALESQVSSLQAKTTILENDRSALEAQVASLQANVSTLQSEVTMLRSEVPQDTVSGYDETEYEGYQTGYDEGYTNGIEDGAGNGWTIRDPTYNEAIAFVNSDKTDENEYTDDYTCYGFTADFKGNAFHAGYRCGFVYLRFPEDLAHAIVCFNTTDRGLIYIEPQDDSIITPTIGQQYWDRTKYTATYDDTIMRINIIW